MFLQSKNLSPKEGIVGSISIKVHLGVIPGGARPINCKGNIDDGANPVLRKLDVCLKRVRCDVRKRNFDCCIQAIKGTAIGKGLCHLANHRSGKLARSTARA